MTNLMDNRDIRQRKLVPPDKLSKIRITIVGVGAVGRQAALQLAAIGVPELHLIDFDTVQVENLAVQGFYERDIGRPKVNAVADICRSINSSIEVTTTSGRFNGLQFTGGVISFVSIK